MLEAACIVAFFGFLRCGEFTVLSSFNPEFNLCLSDVQILQDRILITLKKSKTDPFRQGITIPLFRTDQVVCPVSAVNRYMSLRKTVFLASTEAFL